MALNFVYFFIGADLYLSKKRQDNCNDQFEKQVGARVNRKVIEGKNYDIIVDKVEKR